VTEPGPLADQFPGWDNIEQRDERDGQAPAAVAARRSPADARASIEQGRRRALEVDRALAELRASLREAPGPRGPAVGERRSGRDVEVEPASAYRWLLFDGHEAFCRGRIADALALFDEAAREAPRRIEGHLNVGRTLIRLRRFGEARQAFERALSLEPANAAARAGLADCNWRLELPEVDASPAPRAPSRFMLLRARRNLRQN
jgi:tetratricopeptide (TPR) repeat protein